MGEKYKLPLSHEAFASWSLLDLLTGYWEDYYAKNPTEAKRSADGKEVKFVTGDPLIDKWEDEIAKGIEPDLTEGLTVQDRERVLAAREVNKDRAQAAQQANTDLGDGFEDSYGG